MLALIITIIILLILTMVTYNFLIKGNLIGSAVDAKNKTNIAVEIEQIQVAYLDCELKYEEQNILIDIDSFKESLNDPTVTVTRYEGRLEDGPQLVAARDESTGYALVEFTQTGNQYLIGLFEYDPSIPSYIVTYNANGGYGEPASQRKIQGIDMTISYNVPTRDEYTFTGWALSSNSNTVTYKPGDKYKEDKDITLYAVWVEKEYNIEYELNGGTVTGNPTKYVKSDTIVLKNPTRVGYNFTGWTGTDLDGVTKYVVIENKTGDRKYTANWEICNYIIDDTKYAVTLEAALEQATNGSVIKVQRGAGENGKIEDNSTAIVTKQVTLDLQGSIIQITTQITVEESGNITVVDGGNEKEEYIGQITNTNGTVFINNGTMQLGNNDGAITYTPNLNGSTTAIINNGLLKFYDGQVTGRTAIQGENIETPTDYYAMATVGDNVETVTLQVLGDSVARIGYRYYTTLQNAVDGAPTGEYNTTTETITINERIQKNGTYYFKNEDGKLKPTNKGVSSSVANSYIKFDLSKLDSEQEYELIVNASISSEGNYDIGYATITNSATAPAYNSTTGRFMYISGTVAATDYSTKLKGGSLYYLHLGYRKDGSGNTGDDQVIINSIKFADTTIDANNATTMDIITAVPIPPKTQTKIEVLRNITETNEVIATNKNITFDLKGYTVDLFKPITNTEGSLEIIDSSEGKTGKITNSAKGTGSSNLASTILNSGTLKLSAPISTKNTYSVGIENSGTLEVLSSGVITLNETYSYGIYNQGTGIVTNTGTITSSKSSTYGIYNAEAGTITVTNVGTITLTGSSSYGIYGKGTGIVTNAGTVTATGSSSDGIYSFGTTINEGTIIANYYGIHNQGTGTATNTGTITVTGTSNIYGIYNTAGKVENKGTIEVKKTSGSSSTKYAYGIYNESANEIINNGKITVINQYSAYYAYGIYNKEKGSIKIGEKSNITSGYGVYNNAGTIKITGGEITVTPEYGIYNNTGTIEITGGTITSTGSTGIQNSSGTITIGEKGGEVNTTVPEIKGKTYGVNSTTSGTVNFYDGVVKGITGTFNGEITEIEPDYNVVKERDSEGYENGYLTRYVIAKIGDTEYYNLQSAIDAVSENNSTAVTIRIVRDNAVILSETTITNKKIILDLNGNELDLFKPITNTEGSLEIIDSSEGKTGKITNSAKGTGSSNLASTILNSGTLKLSAPISTKNTYSVGIENSGTLEVLSSGVITLNETYSYGIYNQGTGIVTNTGTITSSKSSTYGIYNAEAGTITVTNVGTITLTGSSSYGIYGKGTGIVTNAGTVTATGSSSDGIYSFGTTINEGTIIANYYGIHNQGTGTATNTGTITVTGTSNIYGIYNTAGKVENKGTIEVKKTSGSSSTKYAYGIYNESANEIINNGKITVINQYSAYYAYGIYNKEKGSIKIGEKSNITSGYGVYNNAGTIKITGGEITVTPEYGIYNNTGTIEITGGTITSTGSTGIQNSSGTITIGEKGGEVNTTVPEIKGKAYGVNSTTAGTINFYDGVVKGITGAFNGTVTELEPNYQILETTVDEYKCAKLLPIGEGIPSASIGSVNYFSLQDAIKSSQDGNVIVVRKNINLETSNLTVDADKNITINLNGYTISSQTDEATIKNEGTLIIKDTSANNTGKIENTTGAAIESKGTLIIGEDDGTINRDAPTIVGGSKGIVNNQGVLKIFDGSITGIVAIEGDVTATPEGHEIVKIPILTKKKATLN